MSSSPATANTNHHPTPSEVSEKAAIFQTLHPKLRTFYTAHQNLSPPTPLSLKLTKLYATYGPFPQFWSDSLNYDVETKCLKGEEWKGWREVGAVYDRFLNEEFDDKSSKRKREESEASVPSPSPAPAPARKSRWGTAPAAAPAAPVPPPSPPRGRSRFSAPTQQQQQSLPDLPGMENMIKPHNPNNQNALAAALSLTNVTQPLAPNLTNLPRTTMSESVPFQSLGTSHFPPNISLNPTDMRKYLELIYELKLASYNYTLMPLTLARVLSLPAGHRDRSPSPEPEYDVLGVKTNTRELRTKKALLTRREALLESIFDLNPLLLTLMNPGFVKRKKIRKVYVPVASHPTYNFIGLIIGPRGKTQKEMENATNCKIAIRGKGSVKEGARGRRDGKAMEGENDPLHVLITGENDADVDKARSLVKDLLVVLDDGVNSHKQKQLKELAVLNGTFKGDDETCTVCGEKGHAAYACPTKFGGAGAFRASVKCAVCGDGSHPTRDCPLTRSAQGPMKDKEGGMDKEYLEFMNEIEGKDKAEENLDGVDIDENRAASTSTSTTPIPNHPPPAQTTYEYKHVANTQAQMGRGRGRGGVSNLPSWMTQQQQPPQQQQQQPNQGQGVPMPIPAGMPPGLPPPSASANKNGNGMPPSQYLPQSHQSHESHHPGQFSHPPPNMPPPMFAPPPPPQQHSNTSHLPVHPSQAAQPPPQFNGAAEKFRQMMAMKMSESATVASPAEGEGEAEQVWDPSLYFKQPPPPNGNGNGNYGNGNNNNNSGYASQGQGQGQQRHNDGRR